MHNQTTHKRTEGLSASKAAIVIGSILLLVAASYMAYYAIDAEALRSSLLG